jgi:hypothetical protein
MREDKIISTGAATTTIITMAALPTSFFLARFKIGGL